MLLDLTLLLAMSAYRTSLGTMPEPTNQPTDPDLDEHMRRCFAWGWRLLPAWGIGGTFIFCLGAGHLSLIWFVIFSVVAAVLSFPASWIVLPLLRIYTLNNLPSQALIFICGTATQLLLIIGLVHHDQILLFHGQNMTFLLWSIFLNSAVIIPLFLYLTRPRSRAG